MEFLRACQKEGLLRLDRDRQGVLRVFPGPQFSRPSATPGGPAPEAVEEAADLPELPLADMQGGSAADETVVADIIVDDAATVVDGEVAPEPGNEALPKPAGRKRTRSRSPATRKAATTTRVARAPRGRKKTG